VGIPRLLQRLKRGDHAFSAAFFFLVIRETTIRVRKLSGTEKMAGLSIGIGALTFTR
jgi:hypothetical protein